MKTNLRRSKTYRSDPSLPVHTKQPVRLSLIPRAKLDNFEKLAKTQGTNSDDKSFSFGNGEETRSSRQSISNKENLNTLNLPPRLRSTKATKLLKRITAYKNSRRINPLKYLSDTRAVLLSKRGESNRVTEPQLLEGSARSISNSNPHFVAFAAQTDRGIEREVNEDKISLVLNIHIGNKKSPDSSYFGVYDGHAGQSCADYLRDNLHILVTEQPCYIEDKLSAIKGGMKIAESNFLQHAQMQELVDLSGSCASVVVVDANYVYIGNLGDSRVIGSFSNGRWIRQLTKDHKPDDTQELQRILKSGGGIAKQKIVTYSIKAGQNGVHDSEDVEEGPYRVIPGGLSVSRTIGDLPSKLEKYGGISGCVSAEPDLYSIVKESSLEFLVIGCDGIFDVLQNSHVSNIVRNSLITIGCNEKGCNNAVEQIISKAKEMNSRDNLTAVVILFSRSIAQ